MLRAKSSIMNNVRQIISRKMAIYAFKLPDLGEKIKEAKVVEWHVKEGDIVEEFDTLADVSTDKLFTQIPSSHSGKIHKLLVKKDEFCNVGGFLLEIDDLLDDIDPSTSVDQNQETAQINSETVSEVKSDKKEIQPKNESTRSSEGKTGKLIILKKQSLIFIFFKHSGKALIK